MVKYKIIKQTNTLSTSDDNQTYAPRITDREKLNISDIGELIALQSTFSKADVVGVIQALVNNIPKLLMQKYTVSLDSLGTFTLHARTTSEKERSKVSAKNIKELRISFRPSLEVKKKLKKAIFKKVD